MFSPGFSHIDPEHPRGKSNLKYFEFQLEKQKKAAEEEAPKQKEREKRETAEKKKKQKKSKKAFSLIPEREKYEMLCRGEGIKMVRKSWKLFITCILQLSFNFLCALFFSLNQTPRRQSRLFCRYYDNNRNPSLLLAPVKQQDEWDRPYIVRYLDIISDAEIERIKQLAKPRVSSSDFRIS